MRHLLFPLFFVSLAACSSAVMAQKTTDPKKPKKNTSLFSKPDPKKLFNPRIATYRSAILPGWGQVTNKKIWKVPIVYAALGITTGIFLNNVKQYKAADKAYTNSIDGDPTNDYLIPQPYYAVKDQPERIKSYRNEVRQNVDYSALFFLLFWGLNVVDAAVDANMKTFDVSDDLSLKFRAGYSPLAQTHGLSIALQFGKNRAK